MEVTSFSFARVATLKSKGNLKTGKVKLFTQSRDMNECVGPESDSIIIFLSLINHIP